jgi:hypothetical protein
MGVLNPGDSASVWVTSGSGWYQVGAPEGGSLGWVNGLYLVLYGDGCDQLMLPTPTQPGAMYYMCNVNSAINSSVNLRSGPGEQYDAINAFSPNEVVEALARSDNGWYRVRMPNYGVDVIGWVSTTQVNVYGACDTLNVVASAGYPPEATVMPPTWTPEPASSAQILYFTGSPTNASPGDTITLSWATSGASNVWLQYYGYGENTPSNGADATYTNLPLTGSMNVTIPPDYNHAGVEFMLVMNYQSGSSLNGLSATVTIPLS